MTGDCGGNPSRWGQEWDLAPRANRWVCPSNLVGWDGGSQVAGADATAPWPPHQLPAPTLPAGAAIRCVRMWASRRALSAWEAKG